MMTTINKITQQFPSRYVLTCARPVALPATSALPLAQDKRDAFWKRYDADEAFQRSMDSNYAYVRSAPYFDFWLVTQELKLYLRPQFVNAEVLLVENGKVSYLSVKQVERALNEAGKDCEKFQMLIVEARDYKLNIWLELEKKISKIRQTV